MASELVRQLVESGIHFGHRASRWDPKMRPYIFGKRNTIHILDIRETVKGLLRAKRFLTKMVADGKDVLFVGTKRQARPSILEQAVRVGMPYVCERWLGGMLTNFRTIRSRLSRLDELEAAEADGTALQYSKKMIATRARELRKIKRNLDGIRKMSSLPGALVVIDVNRESIAVKEARKMGLPTVCLIDTDGNPDYADVPIPGNDDSMRSIDLILRLLADSVAEGLKARAMTPKPQKDKPAPVSSQGDLPPADGDARVAQVSLGGTEVPAGAPAAPAQEGSPDDGASEVVADTTGSP